MSGFDEMYKSTPPWDIGHAQRELVRLEESGEVKGSILDVGCGTGENSLYFASLGHNVEGVDFSPRAIKKAQEKAKKRQIENVNFAVLDALQLSKLSEEKFDNVIDCGLFHTFTDLDCVKFVKGLHSVLKQDGTYFMLCFSDLEPTEWGGPRRVSQKEIRENFADGWKVNYIKEARFESNFHDDGGRAWLSSITRL
jgi:cyclopropane fatty-acyl-phospholipid synthase-like methyltransferase